jgi:hypothetical protein
LCKISKAVSVLSVVAFLSTPLCSQLKISSALIQQDTSFASPDTLGLTGGRIVQLPPSPKSTTLAMALSAVLPGAGQIYTERYLHAPVVWGLGYYLVNQWQKGDRLYRDYGTRFDQSVALDTVRNLGNAQLVAIRDFYHDERDRIGLYIAILYVINIVDAYVGASLYSFEVSDELGGSAAIRFRLRLR